MAGPLCADSLTCRWGSGDQSATFAWKSDAMIQKATFLGVISALFLTCIFLASPPVAANTSLQLEDGVVLSFADGSIDIRTGSGRTEGVVVTEDDVEVLTADYLMIDASGEIGSEDWFINDLVMENAVIVDAGLFISLTEIRDLAAGALDDSVVVRPSGAGQRGQFCPFPEFKPRGRGSLDLHR